MPYYKSKDPRAFFARLSPAGCWEWAGVRSDRGYGKLGSPGGKQIRAHRWVWELLFGPIPDGMNVLHRCDNPPCCRPDHLFLGSHLDNAQDRDRKGRDRHITGENHPRARLSQLQAIEIRGKYSLGTYRQSDLALEYGVTQTTISHIVRGHRYKETHATP